MFFLFEYEIFVYHAGFRYPDILLNLCGGLLGYGIYYCLMRIGEKLPSIFKTDWFLNIVSIIILLGVLVLISGVLW